MTTGSQERRNTKKDQDQDHAQRHSGGSDNFTRPRKNSAHFSLCKKTHSFAFCNQFENVIFQCHFLSFLLKNVFCLNLVFFSLHRSEDNAPLPPERLIKTGL